MGNGHRASLWPGLDTKRRSVPGGRGITTGTAIGLASFSVVLGAAMAALAGILIGGLPPAPAAALGALGAIGALGFEAATVLVWRRTRGGRDQELIDVASPVHPLQRRLMTEAPGTYVHSVAAANLSEAAAEAVGADPLVARVGAYYHDIGKLTQPCFFFENQEDGVNPHDPAQPAKSADIIMSHVTDGYALGKQHRLPERVLDIIREHHGTSLVRYFYHQAARTGVSVYEADFRYQGTRPRSKEAAIVMLADASEASVRAMTEPDPRMVEEAVRSVVADRTQDGQLKDSGLTESDIERIVAVFVKRLVSFRHVRCPYPRIACEETAEGTCAC
jgi:putative nucleotidyltransferase with HDIG domain